MTLRPFGLGLNLTLSVNRVNAKSIWRGMGQAMRLIEGFNGGANRAVVSRVPIYSSVPFRYIRLAFPVFQITGSSLADTLLTGSQAVIRYQAGLEYPYTAGVTGIPARIPALFGGANHVVYDNGTWNASSGLIVSDVIDMGQTIPANTAVGVWVAVELPAGAYTNALPFSWTASNFLDRQIAQQFYTTPVTIAGGAGSDIALSASSLPKMGTTQAGVGGVMTPCMALIQTGASTKCVVIIGDSKTKGVGEGNAGSGSIGDVWGDTQGNRGLFDRGIYRNSPNTTYVNLGRGSDATRFAFLPNAMRYRLEMLALANPTHVINALAHNDMTQTTLAVAWAGSTAYVIGSTVRVVGQGVYICTQAGTSAASGGPTGTGSAIADGGCVWTYYNNDQSGEGLRVALMVGAHYAINRRAKEAAPAAKLLGFCAEPGVTLVANGGADPATDQTVLGGFGGPTSRRGLWNAIVRSQPALLGMNGYIETNPLIEYLGAGTSKWNHATIANRYTNDGTHGNSTGYETGSGAITTQTFV